MKRLLALMILAVGAVGQAQDPAFTNGDPNGLMWMEMNATHKMMAVAGAEAGYREAEFEIGVSVGMSLTGKEDSLPSGVNTYWRKAAAKGLLRGSLIREIDAFYNDGANVSLPWSTAFLYSVMKLGGATKDQLDVALKVERTR